MLGQIRIQYDPYSNNRNPKSIKELNKALQNQFLNPEEIEQRLKQHIQEAKPHVYIS